MPLTPEVVDSIHQQGGTLLGSSRGPQDFGDMIATLRRYDVGILFTIGGDGTLRGASALSREIRRQNLPISIIAIPKTIDNDLAWVQRSFGFSHAAGAPSRAAGVDVDPGFDSGEEGLALFGSETGVNF